MVSNVGRFDCMSPTDAAEVGSGEATAHKQNDSSVRMIFHLSEISHSLFLVFVVASLVIATFTVLYQSNGQSMREAPGGMFISRSEDSHYRHIRVNRKLSTDPLNVNEMNLSSSGGVEERYGGLTRAECKAMYGERKYLSYSQKRLPPLLYTFPGSGNTWCRLLIEYATGIYTGSLYNDWSLVGSLPGEFTCNAKVSVVKAHPSVHPAKGLRMGSFRSDDNKCQRGGVSSFHRAIFLIRDPFDAIWADFQLGVSGSHVAGVKKDNFNWLGWRAFAFYHARLYVNMFRDEYGHFEEIFPKEDLMFLRFEDLKDTNTRIEALRNITQFLNISQPSDAQLECAFALADNRNTHRGVESSNFMTKYEAYTDVIACNVWKISNIYAAKHGYHMWQNISCNSTEPARQNE